MSNFDHKREHIRQLSLMAYVVMLALLIPVTLFAVQKEQEVRTRASSNSAAVTPGFYPLAPCPSCVDPSTPPLTNTSPAPTLPTAPSSSVSQTPTDPCVSSGTSIAHKKNKHKSKHKKNRGGLSKFIQEILKWLIEMINKLLGEGTVKLPEDNTNTLPSTAPVEEEPQEENPCPEPTVVPVSNAPVSTAPQPTISTVAPSQPAGSGTTASVKITFYGSYDNDPKGSKAIANPVKHQEAGGTGTYADPLTFASPAGTGEYKFGQIIYVPLVQKYFIREDECAVSWTAPNGCGAVTMVDLYVGNPSDAEAVVACENSITPSGNAQIIIDPPANLTVDPNPIWNQSSGKCMTPHN